MEIKIIKGEIQDYPDEALVVNLFEGSKVPAGATLAVDQKIGKAISRLIASGDFTGKKNQTVVVYPPEKSAARRIILVGLGKKEKFSVDGIRQAAASACVCAQGLKLKSITTILHGTGAGKIDPELAAQAVVEGTMLANYRFDSYRTDSESRLKRLEKMTIVERDKKNLQKIKSGILAGEVVGWAQCLARDLSNEPPNALTPTKLSEKALGLGKKYDFEVQVLKKAELEKLKMGGLLSVARGSIEPPTFTILNYRRGGRARAPIVLVGKGVTFDSGGISIKAAENMDQMKADMTGGAVVIAAMAAAARLQLSLPLIGLVPAAENLPSGASYKPGDILRTFSGKTIEIINTDAEGRLILADALTYAGQYKPKAIVDIATLTGAMTVALGQEAAGIFGNDQKLIDRLKVAADKAAERIWQFPLWEEYSERIKSEVADWKNSGGRPGSSITAACFLQKFVGDFPWAHLDIANVDIEERGRPYTPKGGSGFGVRLLVQFLRDLVG